MFGKDDLDNDGGLVEDGSVAEDGGVVPDGGPLTCASLGTPLPNFNRRLVFHLPLDEGQGTTVVDPIGGLVGTVDNPDWVVTTNGTGLRFADDSFILVPDHPTLRTDYIEIEATIVLESDATWPGSYQHILSKDGDFILRFWNGGDAYGTGRALGAVVFTPAIYGASAYLPGFRYSGTSPPCGARDVTLQVGRSFRVSLAFDGTFLVVAIDGVIVALNEVNAGRTHSSQAFHIGSHSRGGEGFFGIIDDVKVWELAP